MLFRIYLFYRSYLLFLIFVVVNIAAFLSSYFFPLIHVDGDNPNTIYYNDIPLGIVIYALQAFLLLIGSVYYLRRSRKNARILYDVSLLVYMSQVITIFFRYSLLIAEVSTNPFNDEISISLGSYIYLMAIIIGLGIFFRLTYIGIERRNSVYIIK
jgi:hypothetical protein